MKRMSEDPQIAILKGELGEAHSQHDDDQANIRMLLEINQAQTETIRFQAQRIEALEQQGHVIRIRPDL